MEPYDEDLNLNPFFSTFLHSYLDLFSQCVLEKWLICVPKRDSLPKHGFTIEDFTHHILKPLNRSQELVPIEHPVPISGSSSAHGHRPWNFETLSGVQISYDYNTLFLDRSSPISPTSDEDESQDAKQPIPKPKPKVIRVLFEETFYTSDRQKYRVLCVASQLNSQVVEDCDKDGGGAAAINNNKPRNQFAWGLTSLRDCIDFIWLNGRRNALETYDGILQLFHHNHKGTLEQLPLQVQKDLVFDVFQKCISAGFKSRSKKRGAPVAVAMRSSDEHLAQSTSSCEEADPEPLDSRPIDQRSELSQQKLLDNFKLATETYVLNALYRTLMASLGSCLYLEDANLNKIVRNLADIQPKDLQIHAAHWEHLGRAKLELLKLPSFSSPLVKLECLRRTMKQLECRSEGVGVTMATAPASTSADEMLPMWVYLVAKTQVGNWMAQLEFLKQFRMAGVDSAGSENDFLLATLEAAIMHLCSGKAADGYGYGYGVDLDLDGVVDEDGVREVVADSGQIAWLPASFTVEEDEDEDETAFGMREMFQLIREGNLGRLRLLVAGYEHEVSRRNVNKVRERNGDDEFESESESQQLCHPLCVCEQCTQLHHDNGADPSSSESKSVFELQTESSGVSLLHMACICGRPKIVEFLLSSGASTSVSDHLQMTPLHYASSRGHQNALLLLVHAGADLEAADHMLNTPLHYAALNGHDSCVKALIYYAEHSRQGINLSCQNFNGDTPLHFASRYGFQAIVQILVENGASITVLNARQSSPQDCAHNVHIARILQRSLSRRSLCNMSNHGDYINIEVMRKEPSSSSAGVVMLISEPADTPEEDGVDEGDAKKRSAESVVRPTQKLSYNMSASMSLNVIEEGKVCLSRASSRAPSAVSSRRSSLQSQSSKFSPPMSQSLVINQGESNMEEESNFSVLNPQPCSTFEPEHLKTIPVDNLYLAARDVKAAASSAAVAAKRKRKEEAGMRKLFTAIAIGDIPLSLFYLGIPADESNSADLIRPGELASLNSCHPLCSCPICLARPNGLGLDINVQNLEGLSPLHLAVIYNLHGLVKILLKYHADVDLRSTFEQKTATDLAFDRQFMEIVGTLQDWQIYNQENK